MPLHRTGLIQLALDNLGTYQKQVTGQVPSDTMAAKLLGVASAAKLSPELLEMVKTATQSVLDDEQSYIKECRESLLEQFVWQADSEGVALPVKYKSQLVAVRDKPSAKQKEQVKYAHYEPIRERLMTEGFLVAPRGAALGAIFPVEDWLTILPEAQFWTGLKERTDELARKYRLLGDASDALTRMLTGLHGWQDLDPVLSSAIGCLCISWTRLKHFDLPVYVPVLGLSGVVAGPPDSAYFASYCRQLALPTWAPDPLIPASGIAPYAGNTKIQKIRDILREQAAALGKKDLLKSNAVPQTDEDRIQLLEFRRMASIVQQYEKKKKEEHSAKVKESEIKLALRTSYDTMIERTNRAALGYRARTLMGLRTPARQALLSYVSFRQEKAHADLTIEELQDVSDGVDLWICGWHSLNCAEPAALMTAASLLCSGVDVLVCFPYEGFSETGSARNRPKETCPWCAAVELGFRSLTRNQGQTGQSKTTGQWQSEFTLNIANEPDAALPTSVEFDANDSSNDVMKRTRGTLGGNLVKNKDLDTSAYSQVVETKIGRLRSMYHLLGLLDPEVVALDRNIFQWASTAERTKLLR